MIQAAARADGGGRGVAVRYVAPKEGAQLWFDMLAIPADAPHKDAALAFINFVLQPDVMAGDHQQGALSERGAGQPRDDPAGVARMTPTSSPAGTDGAFFTIGAGAASGRARAHPDVGPLQGRAAERPWPARRLPLLIAAADGPLRRHRRRSMRWT